MSGITERLRLNEDDWLFGPTARTAKKEIEELRAELAAAKAEIVRLNDDNIEACSVFTKATAARDLVISKMRDEFCMLIESCSESDSANYGTLATWFVTDACEKALALQPTTEALDEFVQRAVEELTVWISTQRNDIPATGEEFAAAIRGRKQ